METESLLSWVALHPGCELVPLQVSCDGPMRENGFLNIVFHIKETNTILPTCPRATWVTEDACHSDTWWAPNQRLLTHLTPLFLFLLPS